MKRATKGWLRDQCFGQAYAHGRAQDALDSAARQRAEIRRLKREVKAGLDREKNLRSIFVATQRESEARLNMLEHIEWHNGTTPPESLDGLRNLVGLAPKRKRGGGR